MIYADGNPAQSRARRRIGESASFDGSMNKINKVAEGTVQCEPLSARFPCYQGKIQGNGHSRLEPSNSNRAHFLG